VTVKTGLIEFEMHWLFIQAAGTLHQSNYASVFRGLG